jgi:hypothetical protein
MNNPTLKYRVGDTVIIEGDLWEITDATLTPDAYKDDHTTLTPKYEVKRINPLPNAISGLPEDQIEGRVDND